MKYIPFKDPKYVPVVNSWPDCQVSDDTLGKILDLDPKKIMDKYESFHKKISIGFFDEDGCEYFILVGTKTAPTNTIIIQAYECSFADEPSIEAALRISKFISWLRQQRLQVDKEGD